jgi:hypothetical protein
MGSRGMRITCFLTIFFISSYWFSTSLEKDGCTITWLSYHDSDWCGREEGGWGVNIWKKRDAENVKVDKRGRAKRECDTNREARSIVRYCTCAEKSKYSKMVREQEETDKIQK